MLEKEIYIHRRRRLAAEMKERGAGGIAIFIGNTEAPAQYKDNCYKFRQDSTWLYYFGIDIPKFAAVIDIDTGFESVYADDPDIDDIIWTGPLPSVQEIAENAGINSSAPYQAFANAVNIARKSGRDVHFIPASRYYNIQMLKELGLHNASEDLIRSIIEMRLVKDKEEIALLDKAADLGYMMHIIGRKGIRIGEIEQNVVGEMEGFCLAKGWGTSFPTIFTQHGEIFHNHSHNCTIEPGKLLLIDAGFESNNHYASDFTRTYPTTGMFTQKQRDIYQIVYECNENAFRMVAPGISYRDIHLATARLMLERLSGLGLVHGNLDDMLTEGIAGLFMPHGLGHNIGLDAHDMEDLGEDLVGYDCGQTRSSQLGLKSLRMARRLVSGNVITDEPGIYFIPALIELWRKNGIGGDFVNYSKLEGYYDFGGIRLEDDLVVTADGVRRLGSYRLPISPDDVEAAMANDKQ